jgi:hypothetical protein
MVHLKTLSHFLPFSHSLIFLSLGTLVTGQGHRAFWNSTQELRTRLSELANRVRELEDALAGFAGDGHHLLRDELRRMKDPFMTENATNTATTSSNTPTAAPSPASSSSRSGSLHPQDEAPVIVDATGALTVAEDGAIEYIGHEAKLWVSSLPLSHVSHLADDCCGGVCRLF